MNPFEPEARKEAERTYREAFARFVEARHRQEAVRLLHAAVSTYPDHAASWNLLALAALSRGRVKDAEERLEKARRAAENEFRRRIARRSVDDPVYREWLVARKNIALVKSRRREHAEAALLLEELLADAPSDPLNVRWLVGEEWLKAGEPDCALERLREVGDEPGCRYTHALVLHVLDRPAERDRALLRAFVANRYVPPLLLGNPMPRRRGFHPSNMAEPEWARGYVRRMERVWKKTRGALRALEWVWQAPGVVTWRQNIVDVSVRIVRADPRRRGELLDRLVDLISEPRLEQLARSVSSRD